MTTTTNEPSALTAALSSPAFVTKGGGMAMHVANRHVSRWAPEVGEAGANRIRPLKNLGFVDRLVSPWIESAQRSASMRMFSQYLSGGVGERQTNNVSWVFPRPWYQDELDWMAAARTVGQQSAMGDSGSAPQMFTTRGTYVAPVQQQSQLALPSALYEYVAPSLSIAKPNMSGSANDAYSPLVPLASTQAAHVMARAMAPIMGGTQQNGTAAAARMSPGLRAVLTSMLERSAVSASANEAIPSRVSSYAPELVTPPSPRADTPAAASASYESAQSTQVAEQYAEQRSRIVELQRVARVAAEREYVARQTPEAARAADPRMAEVRAAEVRAVEQRQAELQQRATEVAAQRGAERTTADVARRDAERVAVDTERARIEERIAQRIAERTGQQEAQRLHSASRDAAARDARTAPMPMPTMAAPEARSAAVESRVATEIAAAVAALPPELASMVAAGIGSRPERAVQAIAELGEALRAVELIARNNASGGSIESTRGPRLVMPTGLGGLVSTVERTTGSHTQARVPAAFAMPTAAPIGMQGAMPAAPQARREMRMPAMQFLAAPNAPAQASSMPASTSALGAATSTTPAALSHVAWSDRWLARFAGAKTQSLDVLSAANASPEMRYEMLAAAAPGTVFVAPFFDDRPRAMPSIVGEPDAGMPSRTGDAMPTLRNAQPSQPVTRFADDAETPDDVFAAIASAANRARTTSAATASSTAFNAPSAAASAAPAMTFDRETLADLVAQSAPSAPGAGLSAGLASSPFAPALRHVLPLGTAPTFDVRALFGSGLGATYLAGLLAANTDEISVAAQTLPTWATWGQTPMSPFVPSADSGEMPMRDVADWSPTYVAPELQAGRVDAGTAEGEVASAEVARAEAIAEYNAPLTTLRSALLSWDVETIAAQSGPSNAVETRVSPATTSYSSAPLARSIIDSMTLPMLAESAALRDVGALDIAGMSAQASSYAAPGMIADRAQSWSVAQERSTSDLSFDFVSPELVLAARVYGLGPAEAAQAARLATAGPGQLTAMAGAVDRTFVQALAIESERRGERTRSLTTAYPMTAEGGARTASSTMSTSTSISTARTDDGGAYADDAAPVPTAATSMFGVERRMPRGAFLWPTATTAALGLNAATPDGELSMSVAALELLAAQAVAELGTYAALGEHPMFAGSDDAAGGTTSVSRRAGGMPVTSGGDAIEADVLASADAMVPSSRKDKFQALYLALGQSPSGRNWSPAARAARALALAGRGDESVSARERASVAWEVLPMVYGMADEAGETLSTGDAAVRATRRREELRSLDAVFVDGRPGLGALSARAGEALGSYVAPNGFASATGSAGSGASSSSRSGGEGAVMRAPTAAQELVQTGRPSGRHGGGELEIPAWFEAAARKMLEDRSSVSDGISLADLTLVQTAAPQQIAASSRGEGGGSQPIAPSPASSSGAEKDKIDIDKLANEVYREILVMMDIARARNGEPYL
jgi:hypothetical protein